MEAGITVTDADVCMPSHRYVPPEVVRVALSPAQIMPSLGVAPYASKILIPGVGSAFTITVRVAVAEQIFASVTVTV